MKNKLGKNILRFVLLVFLYTSCEKESPDSVIETGTITDIDGNEYKTVKIGNQWWMAENLKVTRYRNGNPVQEVTQNDQWQSLSAAYCNYQNNTNETGLLYNWHCVNDPNVIAPEGWHIPTDEEWKELEIFLGMNSAEVNKQNWRGTNEGEKLKVEGTLGWALHENAWPTNESGFTALAGSCRLVDGTWGDPGVFSTGFWWTSTKYSENQVWYRYLDYKNSRVYRGKTSANYGFSIRCVKD